MVHASASIATDVKNPIEVGFFLWDVGCVEPFFFVLQFMLLISLCLLQMIMPFSSYRLVPADQLKFDISKFIPLLLVRQTVYQPFGRGPQCLIMFTSYSG